MSLGPIQFQCPICLEVYAEEHFNGDGPCKDCEKLSKEEQRDLRERSIECYSMFAVPP